MQNSNGNSLRNITLSVAILSGLLVAIQPASAKQFKKLVETGQVVIGNDKPIVQIADPTIGLDGQVAVNLQMETTVVPPGIGINFLGIYSITKGGKISLLDQGSSSSNRDGGSFQGFLPPSISQGKIVYAAYSYAINRRGERSNANAVLKGGTPGDIKEFALITTGSSGPFSPEPPQVSFVDGTAYTINKEILSQPGAPIITYQFKSLDTNAATPSFTPISSSPDNRQVRTSGLGVVLLTVSPQNVYTLFERPNNGQFTQLNPLGQNPGSCGFAVSSDNIVSCSVAGSQYVLSLRLGRQGNFVAIPLPNAAALKSVSDPSISGKNVIFRTTEQTAIGTVDKIYNSLNRQAPKLVLAAGDQLEGKTVTGLKLNENGRTIARNSAVFTATFSDGSSALYRVDL